MICEHSRTGPASLAVASTTSEYHSQHVTFLHVGKDVSILAKLYTTNSMQCTCVVDSNSQGLLDMPQVHGVASPSTRSLNVCLSVTKRHESSAVTSPV